MLHSVLSKLPKPLDLQGLIHRTSILFADYPPQRLPGRAWASISSHSVLKTTRDPRQLASQTLQDGESMFTKQDLEIRRSEARKIQLAYVRQISIRYRRPAAYAGAAIVAALLATMLRSSDA